MENTQTECQAVLSRLYAYLDGEIAEGDAAEVDRHLEMCVECARRAVARTEGTLLGLEKAALVELLARHPAIALRWLSSVVKRLEHANRRIVSLTVGDLRARTLALLAEELVGRNGRADLHFTQGEIAALLGATRQSVNRVLGHLAKEGLVRQQYGAIEVLDGERILKLAGDGALAGGIC